MRWWPAVRRAWQHQPAAIKAAQAAFLGLALYGATCGDRTDLMVGLLVGGPSDIDNQAAVLARVAAGEPYYPAVIDETRLRGYPTTSPFNVRLPTLVWFLSAMPVLRAAVGLMILLGVVTTALWCWHLMVEGRRRAIWAAVPLGLSMLPIWLYERAIHLNDLWAGQLIALSIAARTLGWFPLSLGAGLAAVLVRELAMPYVVLMGAAAFLDGQRREGWLWLAVAVAGAAAVVAHALAVHNLLSTGAASSQWLVLGGWCFALRTARMNPLLMHLPNWLHAAVVSFLLAGAWSWQPSANTRLALVVTGFFVCFLLVGRPDNAYWGLLIAPLLPLGVLGWGRR